MTDRPRHLPADERRAATVEALIDLAAPRHNRQHVRRWSEFEWSMRTFFPSLGDLRLRTLLDRAVA